jgi:hypothetical protein
MNILFVLIIGALMGGLNGVGIFFEPREPYKVEILLAATLKGILISLFNGLFVRRGQFMVTRRRIWNALRFCLWIGNLSRERGFQIQRCAVRRADEHYHRPHHRRAIGEFRLLKD